MNQKRNINICWIALCLILNFSAVAQEQDDTPLDISIKTILTDFQNEAISLGIDYARSLDSLFQTKDILLAQDKSLFQLTPGIHVQTGTEDAFSSIQLKLSGIFMTFKTTYVGNQVTPDLNKGFQTFPISLGIETNNRFNTLNTLAEAGWVPWFKKNPNGNMLNPFRTIRLGLFVQSGYKFNFVKDSLAITCPKDTLNLCDGEADESHEAPNSFLLRAKGSLKIDTQNLITVGNVGLGLSGAAHGWYDIKNNAWYYRAQAALRMYFSRQNNKYFDIAYQKGSGAPNFNAGSQFGMGLTVAF